MTGDWREQSAWVGHVTHKLATVVLVPVLIAVVMGLILRIVLPSDYGIDFAFGGVYRMIPLNKVGFWLCIGVGGVVAVVLSAKR